MMSLWDALRMNMMISYQELVRTFPKKSPPNKKSHAVSRLVYRVILQPIIIKKKEIMNV